ncbi:FAD-binding oxidoreductase [Candidatus Frankia meridionalis]|uniref:Alkylglycerone-phosphate synthase n=1 Tax=Candidatus Protofrankia datiscae TaxID=2716812 RepID=F8B176_9ACTN|nr:Alkylglycerone-phosphate synthase [Candidatus Protofrankia datiscae]
MYVVTASTTNRSGTVWWGWGAPDAHTPLAEDIRSLLEAAFAVARQDTPPVGLDELHLPASSLSVEASEALAGVVGPAWVRVDAGSRVRRCRGRSTADLLRLRAGDALDAPDAVVLPAGHDEVLAVLRVCARLRLAVVPFGGGTSVVGGLAPARGGFAGVVALDLARLDRLTAVDAESQVVTCEPGLRGPALEAALAAHGFTLGHRPQSWEYASVGGFAATRSSGQASAGYGRFDSLVVGLRIATPAGTWELGRAPASAAGPDLRQLALGSEGAFGVITQLRLRVRPLPAATHYEGWRLAGFAAGTAALRELAQRDLLPTVARLSDETETAAGLAGGGIGADAGGCRLIAGYEGEADWVAARQAAVAEVLGAAGGVPLGAEAGTQWVRGRFHGPYLRDALLDAGMFAETLETAGFWSALPGLYTRVRDTLVAALTAEQAAGQTVRQAAGPPAGATAGPAGEAAAGPAGAGAGEAAAGGAPGLVMCHVSHVYPTGASLYFTVVCPGRDDPVARWRRVKAAASRAIVETGGTITHHHAVGVDHQPWLTAEIGDLGVAVLRAVKHTLDPDGILNPGVLVPRAT